ncbi:MAG: peptidylprolyl isomerase [Opitutales bacterium]|jgi:peptidyl-prolyl cis-trans isomerase A (cyclophilin A)|nr:peptidylprolyl isomerase [Opitutales bacterium]
MSESTNPTVAIETNKGTITIELFKDQAPISAENFLSYVEKDFFADTIFHRVIPNFMIQGGGFKENMLQKDVDAPIKNEADNGVKNEKYTLAMARTQVVDSATSQFFINTADNAFLDHGGRDFGYAVFGKVVEGTEVVDAIGQVATGNKGMHQDVPVEAVVIQSAKVVS